MRLFSALIFYLLLIQASCKTDAPYHETYKDVAYGADIRNKMDVFLPAHRDSNTEVVILIHGGGWIAGDKEDFSGSDFKNQLLHSGFAVVSMNYRYACGDYHKQMEDIDNAIRVVTSKSEEWNIADSNFALLGGSAGGHLALLYAHAFDSMHVVKAVVSLVGPTDLTDTLFHAYAANYKIAYVFEQLLGATFEDNLQLYRDASPVFYQGDVPSLFIYGMKDDLVPYQHGLRMNDSLVLAGIPSDAIIFDDAGHNVFGDKNQHEEQVLTAVNNWMLNHLDNK